MRYKLSALLIASVLSTQLAFADNGSYTVPVNAELQPFATFAVSVDSVKTPGHLALQYALPEELTGVSGQTISLEGDTSSDPTAPVVLTGPKGSASCSSSTVTLTCSVKMHDLASNPSAIASLIQNESSNSSEVASRTAVANIFLKEPVGIVTYNY